MSQGNALTIQRKWLFLTYNDGEEKLIGPTIVLEELVKKLAQWEPYYGIAGEEKAPTTGMRHYHVVICCRRQVRSRNGEVLELKGVKPHLERIENNLKRVIKYCMKDGNYAEFNKNDCPVKLEMISKEEKNQMLLSGDLKEQFLKGTLGAVEIIRAYKLRSLFQTYEQPDPFKKKLVLWFKGPTGEGKTRKAVEIAEKFGMNYWISNEKLQWFDGFNGQEVAIIDDFRKNMVTDWNYLLRLLDGYSLLVQVKGGHVKWNPKIIIITTPASPEECFQWISKDGELQLWDRQDQLTRRLVYDDQEQVYEFPLWEEDERRLMKTIKKFLGINDEAMVEEEFELSPILPEPSQIDEA